MLDVVCLPVGSMAANCYLLSDTKTGDTAIIDPGDDPEYVTGEVQKRHLVPKFVVATHGHFDHVMGAAEVHTAFNVPFFIHNRDEFLLQKISESVRYFLGKNITVVPPHVSGNVSEGSTMTLGSNTLLFREVPGHTPGSVVIESSSDQFLVVGDTIFAGGGVGRTDFSYSDHAALMRSLDRILSYPPVTRLYPGHGEATTVARERKYHAVNKNM